MLTWFETWEYARLHNGRQASTVESCVFPDIHLCPRRLERRGVARKLLNGEHHDDHWIPWDELWDETRSAFLIRMLELEGMTPITVMSCILSTLNLLYFHTLLKISSPRGK